MSSPAGFTDPAAIIGVETTQRHARQAVQAPIVQQPGRTATLAAQMQPMQCRSATRLKVGLVPHSSRRSEAAA
jgi:hypothetical protein